MTLTQLEYILALDELRHFHKAAKSCNVTQPTLSMQVNKLEESLGFLIFDRSKTPIKPTKEGAKYLQKARSIVKLANELKSYDFSSDQLSGEFRLGIIPTLAPYLIPLFIKDFVKLYPNVKLHIEEMQTEVIIEQLEKDKIDGALLVTPLKHNLINERRLYLEELFFFCDKNNPLLKRKSVDPSQIKEEELWIMDKGHCFRDQTLNLCGVQEGNLHPNKLFNYKSGSIETLIKLVNKLGGATLLPEMSLEGLTPSQKNQQVLKVKGTIPTREVSLVHSRLFEKEAIIEAIEKTIKSNLPPNLGKEKKNQLVIPIYND